MTLKNSENNGTEEIGLVTPTPDQRLVIFVHRLQDSYPAHDDVIKWKHFPRYWPFVQGIRRLLVNSVHKGQWYRALMFFLICASISGWVNSGEAGDLRRHRGHYDVTVMALGQCYDWLPWWWRSSQAKYVKIYITRNWWYINNNTKQHKAKWSYTFCSGVAVTKAPFVNFSESTIFDLAKVPVRFYESLSYLTDIAAAELRRYLINIDVIFNN